MVTWVPPLLLHIFERKARPRPRALIIYVIFFLFLSQYHIFFSSFKHTLNFCTKLVITSIIQPSQYRTMLLTPSYIPTSPFSKLSSVSHCLHLGPSLNHQYHNPQSHIFCYTSLLILSTSHPQLPQLRRNIDICKIFLRNKMKKFSHNRSRPLLLPESMEYQN